MASKIGLCITLPPSVFYSSLFFYKPFNDHLVNKCEFNILHVFQSSSEGFRCVIRLNASSEGSLQMGCYSMYTVFLA